MGDPHGDRIIFPVWCGGNILLLYELENGSEPVNYFAVCVFIIYLFKNKVAPMHAKLREKLAQMNTYAQENISGNRVVKAFAREAYEIEKFDRANKDYAETNKETSMVWLKFFPYVESIANLMPVVMLAVGGVF